MSVVTVKAKKLRSDEGDTIPALDNAYVYRVERTGYEDNEVEILMHDANGDEMTLTCGKDMPITIERR